MKVKIRKPVSWSTTSYVEQWWFEKTHSIKFHEVVKDKDYTRLDKIVVGLLDAWHSVILVPCNKVKRWVRDHITKTYKIKIDYWDTWSMDCTLSPIIAPMLKQLRETNHGYGLVDNEDVPEHLRASDADLAKIQIGGSMDDNGSKRWDWVMAEMIYAFEISTTDWGDQFHTGEADWLSVPVDNEGNEIDEDNATLYRMDTGPNDTSHFDADGHKIMQDRIQNGFRLFGKYYSNLWD